MSLRRFYAGKRVFVTGHTGFKGSWLTLWLAELGAEVTGYALPPETTPSLFKLARVGERCRHIAGDVRDADALAQAVADAAPDAVFHLAAQPLVRRSYREPKETFDVNVGGTVNLLEAVRGVPSVRAVVVVTSDKCYENREWIWGYRENDPLGGHDPYSASKAAAEIAVAAYIRSFFSRELPGVASARAGNVIGGGDFGEDRILPDAVRAALAGVALEVRHPEAVRPWQHVLEPLGAYLALAVRLASQPRHYEGAWNFGPLHRDVARVEELVERFYGLLGHGTWRAPSAGKCEEAHEATLLWLCCDKAQAELAWRPVYSGREAIDATAAWYRDVLWAGRDALERCVGDIARYVEMAHGRGEWWAQ